jgi:predicted RND superfamily exporter protein
MQFLIDQLLAKRKVLTLLTLLLGGVAATGIQHVTTDNSDDALLSEDDPNRAEVEQVRKDFPSSTAVLFAFLPASGDVFSLEVLHAMEDLTSRYSEVESAVSVGSLLNQRLNAVDADRLDRDYLIPDLSTLSQDDANDVRDIALADDLLTKTMLSPEGDMALAVIKYRATKDDQASAGRSSRYEIPFEERIPSCPST